LDFKLVPLRVTGVIGLTDFKAIPHRKTPDGKPVSRRSETNPEYEIELSVQDDAWYAHRHEVFNDFRKADDYGEKVHENGESINELRDMLSKSTNEIIKNLNELNAEISSTSAEAVDIGDYINKILKICTKGLS